MTPIEIFAHEVLKSQSVPADLVQLFALELQRTQNEDENSLMDTVGFTLCKTAHDLLELHDKSYLSPKDLQDPDIQANVYAIDRVFELITFVAFDEERNWFGYWHGTDNTPIGQAAVVKYDNEGQFSLCGGQTMTEALICDAAGYDDETFEDIKSTFAQHGIHVSASAPSDLAEWPTGVTPEDYHHRLYSQKRGELGLPAAQKS